MYGTRSNFSKTKLLEAFKRHYNEVPDKQINSAARRLADSLAISGFTFNAPSKISRNGKPVLLFPEWRENVILRKIDLDLRQCYGIVFPDRELLMAQIIELLSQGATLGVIRTDVKSFFESINLENVKEKIHNDRFTCSDTYALLESLSAVTRINGEGLPRGLPIASTLAEIWMQEFDRSVRNISGVYFYARYVDDIIILTYGNADAINSEVNSLMKRFSLRINEAKTSVQSDFSSDEAKVEYLGYVISRESFGSGGQGNLSIEISAAKVNKIKTRIIKSYLSFGRDSDFSLLRDRILFLTGSYPIFRKGGRLVGLKGGICFSYGLINNISKLKELDTFKAKATFTTKKAFQKKTLAKLTVKQKRKIAEMSFVAGFQQKRYTDFRPFRLTKIMEAFR